MRDADLVVLAVPPRATLDLMVQLASALQPGAFLSDVCSVKVPVVQQAVAVGLGDRFAGGHPLAGTHESGFSSARPDRLRGCVVYVCDTETEGGHHAAGSIASFWQHTMGASPVRISAQNHDRQLAWTSHLPQAVAYALANSLAEHGLAGVSYGSGARDVTRLAASSPDMRSDILLYNQPAVCEALERTEEHLGELRRLLTNKDLAGLHRFLSAAQTFRQGIDR